MGKKTTDTALGLIQLPDVQASLSEREQYAHNDNQRLIQQLDTEDHATGHRADFIRYGAKRLHKELDKLAVEFDEFFGSFDILTNQDMYNILLTTLERLKPKKEK